MSTVATIALLIGAPLFVGYITACLLDRAAERGGW